MVELKDCPLRLKTLGKELVVKIRVVPKPLITLIFLGHNPSFPQKKRRAQPDVQSATPSVHRPA